MDNETMENKTTREQLVRITDFECRHCSKRISINGNKSSVHPVGWKFITKESDHSLVSFHLCPECYTLYKSGINLNVL